MPERVRTAVDEWRRAEADAKAAEGRLKAAWDEYDKHGHPPSADLVEEVHRLRSIADEKLSEAMRLTRLPDAPRSGGRG
jgi:hypothetical protein